MNLHYAIQRRKRKEGTKVLTQNDFTNELKTKLDALQVVDSSGLLHVIRKANIDGKTIGAINLGTVPDGDYFFYPLGALLIARTVTGFVSASIITIGTNGATYDNIISATALTSLTVAGKYLKADILAGALRIAPLSDIYVNIGTIAVGTAFNFDVTLYGLLN